MSWTTIINLNKYQFLSHFNHFTENVKNKYLNCFTILFVFNFPYSFILSFKFIGSPNSNGPNFWGRVGEILEKNIKHLCFSSSLNIFGRHHRGKKWAELYLVDVFSIKWKSWFWLPVLSFLKRSRRSKPFHLSSPTRVWRPGHSADVYAFWKCYFC